MMMPGATDTTNNIPPHLPPSLTHTTSPLFLVSASLVLHPRVRVPSSHSSSVNLERILLLDNEWSECTGYDSDPTVNDVVKTRWRRYFTRTFCCCEINLFLLLLFLDGSDAIISGLFFHHHHQTTTSIPTPTEGSFTGFDRVLPQGGAVTLVRDPVQTQNFFFYYPAPLDIAFFGLTEPADDKAYNSVNAAFVQSQLTDRSPKAVVVFGHAPPLSNQVRTVLPLVPILYVTGSIHTFCAAPLNGGGGGGGPNSNSRSVTVAAGTTAPLLFSIVTDAATGSYSFHYESTPYGCT
jgi:hypothetical protein